MAYKHPYTLGSTHLTQIIQQLRKSFPPVVNADTLKKLSIAPNNESYVINTLKFIGVIDDEGNKTKQAATVFSLHDNNEFNQGLAKLVREAYKELFDLHGEEAWSLDQGKLIAFFRSTDESGAEVGRRQASTFQTLATLAGKGQLQKTSSQGADKATTKPVKARIPKKPVRNTKSGVPTIPLPASVTTEDTISEKPKRDIGLTVRIEINLPAVSDQAIYDMIFRSIRENLIDAE